jgi:tetratricopeptide (TPR) repeat protein
VLLQATGDQAGAEQALRRALACFDGSPITALADFADWHMGNHRYARAVELAQRLYQISHEPKDLPRMDRTFLRAHRLAGRAQDIIAWVRERCPGNEAPADLAYQVYYAYSTSDHALAAGAARVLAARQQDDTRTTAWRIREAEQLAWLGDDTAITTEWQSAKTVDAWATLSDILADLTRYELANQAAERAYALDPGHADALAALCHARQRQGDHEGALIAAQGMLERYPYDHRGAELLGFLHARRMQVDPALAMSERALDAAPYCHNTYEARAMALFAAGRPDEARLHAEQTLAISPEPEVSASESRLILYALGEARELAQRCFEKIPQGTRDLGAAYYARLLGTTQPYSSPILP